MKNTEIALNVLKHYKTFNPQLRNYYGIVAGYGLMNIAEIAGEGSEEMEMAKHFLASYPDHIDHVGYNFPSYRIGGNPKARAVYMGYSDEKETIRVHAEEMLTAPRNALGIISRPRQGHHERIWIDAATAVTPFLVFAGHIFDEQKYYDEAVKQTIMMYDVFMDANNGLLHQAQGFCDGYSPAKFSEDHWSRGNGWGLFPLAELVEHLPKEHPEYGKVVRYYINHVDALIPYQSENGLWRQEITLESYHGLPSYEETSGTGLIAYAIGIGIRTGILDRRRYLPVFNNAISGLKKISIGENFEIYNSCPSCLSPGDGTIFAYLSLVSPVDENHGAGPVVMALAEAHRCGLVE